VRVLVQCVAAEDPDLERAPADVVVRPYDLEPDDLQQLRRVLRTLVTTAARTVIVDLSDVGELRRTNVVAILVGAAREARTTGSTLHVVNAPADGRHALFVAGIDDVSAVPAPAYEVSVGTAPLPEALAV